MNPMLREFLLTGLRRLLAAAASGWAGYLIAEGVYTKGEADAFLTWVLPLVAAGVVDASFALYRKYVQRRVKLILSSSETPMTLETAKQIEKATRKTGSSIEVNGQTIMAEDVPSVKTPDHVVSPVVYVNTGDGTPGSATPVPERL